MQMEVYSILAALFALVFAGILAWQIKKFKKGDEKMEEIAGAIRQGAMAYLAQQYKVIAIFAVILFVLLWVLTR